MSEIAPLIADLALILIFAGVMTLLFKRLGQPLVLGYIVAGFLAGPHFGLLPSVMDMDNIHIWSDIGVIFLLFALGLEFSIKKIMKVGGPAILAAMTIIIGMVFTGFMVGSAFGWKRMDAIFLGGMIAMSSTTIIYKAFEDLGLAKKQFASLVMSILILEDILAVVLMVLLSTMAVSSSFEGSELLMSIGKLVFFLVLWFVVGIFLIPLLLKKARKLMNQETLLVVSLGLCFGMVVLAAKAGFSAAFGAFIMGSILAETVEAEHIEHLVKPVKDLFGAIFFVSVGMMVDPKMIGEHWLPILVITLAVIIGQALFATAGVLLSGKPLKTAIQCGFSLTQIGEFAFIIATLGLSLKVTSEFLYPIVVAVSVITIFITPYMIKLAEPAYNALYKILPAKWKLFLDNYNTGGAPTESRKSPWRTYVTAIIRTTVIYGIICLAIVLLSFRLLVPFLLRVIPGIWGSIVAGLVTLVLMAPFLRSMIIKKNHSPEFKTLWNENNANKVPLVGTIVIRMAIAMVFVMYVLGKLFHFSVILIALIAFVVVAISIFSRVTKRNSQRIERTFMNNLNSRERQAEYLGEKKPEYADELLTKDLHLADFDIPQDVEWAGEPLSSLNFGKRFGVHVVSILRGGRRINIPGPRDRVLPLDKIQVIGTDSALEAFGAIIVPSPSPDDDADSKAMQLRCVKIGDESPFLDRSVKDSGLRSRYHCLVAGIEKPDGTLHAPDPNTVFTTGDKLWLVGEDKDLEAVENL